MSIEVPWDFGLPERKIIDTVADDAIVGDAVPPRLAAGFVGDDAEPWIGDQEFHDEIASSVRDALHSDAITGLQQSLRSRAARAGLDLTVEDGRQVVTLDARSRSVRTFLTGLGFDVIFALLALVGTLTGEEFLSKAGLATLGVLALKTVFTTTAAYVARLKFAPTARVSVSALGIHGGDAALAQRMELVTVPVPRPNSRPIGGK